MLRIFFCRVLKDVGIPRQGWFFRPGRDACFPGRRCDNRNHRIPVLAVPVRVGPARMNRPPFPGRKGEKSSRRYVFRKSCFAIATRSWKSGPSSSAATDSSITGMSMRWGHFSAHCPHCTHRDANSGYFDKFPEKFRMLFRDLSGSLRGEAALFNPPPGCERNSGPEGMFKHTIEVERRGYLFRTGYFSGSGQCPSGGIQIRPD